MTTSETIDAVRDELLPRPGMIRLTRGRGGLYYELTNSDGREVIVQTDWDYPGTASTFGYVPCECGETDGTVDCEHKTATEMITAAADWLDDHDGEDAPDPGYFD